MTHHIEIYFGAAVLKIKSSYKVHLKPNGEKITRVLNLLDDIRSFILYCS